MKWQAFCLPLAKTFTESELRAGPWGSSLFDCWPLPDTGIASGRGNWFSHQSTWGSSVLNP